MPKLPPLDPGRRYSLPLLPDPARWRKGKPPRVVSALSCRIFRPRTCGNPAAFFHRLAVAVSHWQAQSYAATIAGRGCKNGPNGQVGIRRSTFSAADAVVGKQREPASVAVYTCTNRRAGHTSSVRGMLAFRQYEGNR